MSKEPTAEPVMESHTSLLAHAPLFRSVNLEAIRTELEQASRVDLAAGEVLLEPSQANDDIFILLSGQMIASLDSSMANPLAVIQAGECIGELSVIDDHPPSAYVVASTPVNLLKMPRRLLWEMQDKEKALSFNLLRILAERMRVRSASLLNTLELQRQYRNQAETDVLTGLKNRTWMEEIFPRQLELTARLEQAISLAMIDIDHFKSVNDDHGHRVGDLALRRIGGLIREHCRSVDLAARYGGEEIAMLMPATGAEQAAEVAERLRKKVEDTAISFDEGQTLHITISVGIASGLPGVTLDSLFVRADQALYRAKLAGRNRVVSNKLNSLLGLPAV